MRIVVGSILMLTRLAVVVVVITACATGGDQITPAASFTTMMPGWESKFTVAWTVDVARDGTRLLSGRVTSRYGQYATQVALLGQALDASGNVVSQRIEQVPGDIPGFSSTYFQISRLAPADHYRVTVWAYSLGRGGM